MATSTADFMLRLINRVSGPARAISSVLDKVTAAEDAVTKSSGAAQAAVSSLGAATATAASKAAATARSFESAADAMKRMGAAARSAARSAAAPAAALRIGADGALTAGYAGTARVAGGFGRGIRVPSSYLTSRANPGVQGPRLDRAAQAASIDNGPIGPVLNRRAQDLSLFDRMDVATKGLRDWNRAAGEGIEKWGDLVSGLMRTPFGFVLRGLGGIASGLLSIASSAASAGFTLAKLTVGAGLLAGGYLVKKTVEMSAFAEASKLAFKYLTGSETQGKWWLDTATSTAAYLGASIHDTVDQFKSLRAAQFGLAQSDALVRMSADLVAVTGHADAAERAIRAITQIKSAGRLQGDELNQLAEAGVSRDMVYQQLEKRLGKNRAGVLKLQEAGKIDANTAIAAIQAAVSAKLHTAAPGDAARQMSTQTATGLWTRLKHLPDRLFYRIGEELDAAPIKSSLQKLGDALSHIEGDGVKRFVETTIKLVPKATDFILGFFDGFGRGIDGLVKGLGMSEGDFKAWGESAGVAIVTFFDLARSGVTWLAMNGAALWSKFTDGLSVQSIIAKVEELRPQIERFGRNLFDIAEALGSIASAALTLFRLFNGARSLTPMKLGQGTTLLEDSDARSAALQADRAARGFAKGDFDWEGGLARTREMFRAPWEDEKLPSPSASGGAGGRPSHLMGPGSRRPTNQTVNVSVNVSGNASREDADEIARKAAASTQDALLTLATRSAHFSPG